MSFVSIIIYIIQISYNLIIMFIASYAYRRMLSFQSSDKFYKTLYYLINISLMLLGSLFVNRYSLTASFQFMLTLAIPPLFFFKDSLLSRISAYFLIVVLNFFSECIASSFFTLINFFSPENNINLNTLAKQGKLLPTLTCYLFLIISFSMFCKFIITVIEKLFPYMHLKTLLLLSFPFFLIFFSYNIIIVLPTSYTFISSVILWIIFMILLCILLLGLKALEKQNIRQLEKENRKKQLMQQAEHYERLYHETLIQRRWAHDMSNHLATIHHMLEHNQLTECETYIDQIITFTETTFKE